MTDPELKIQEQGFLLAEPPVQPYRQIIRENKAPRLVGQVSRDEVRTGTQHLIEKQRRGNLLVVAQPDITAEFLIKMSLGGGEVELRLQIKGQEILSALLSKLPGKITGKENRIITGIDIDLASIAHEASRGGETIGGVLGPGP